MGLQENWARIVTATTDYTSKGITKGTQTLVDIQRNVKFAAGKLSGGIKFMDDVDPEIKAFYNQADPATRANFKRKAKDKIKEYPGDEKKAYQQAFNETYNNEKIKVAKDKQIYSGLRGAIADQVAFEVVVPPLLNEIRGQQDAQESLKDINANSRQQIKEVLKNYEDAVSKIKADTDEKINEEGFSIPLDNQQTQLRAIRSRRSDGIAGRKAMNKYLEEFPNNPTKDEEGKISRETIVIRASNRDYTSGRFSSGFDFMKGAALSALKDGSQIDVKTHKFARTGRPTKEDKKVELYSEIANDRAKEIDVKANELLNANTAMDPQDAIKAAKAEITVKKTFDKAFDDRFTDEKAIAPKQTLLKGTDNHQLFEAKRKNLTVKGQKKYDSETNLALRQHSTNNTAGVLLDVALTDEAATESYFEKYQTIYTKERDNGIASNKVSMNRTALLRGAVSNAVGGDFQIYDINVKQQANDGAQETVGQEKPETQNLNLKEQAKVEKAKDHSLTVGKIFKGISSLVKRAGADKKDATINDFAEMCCGNSEAAKNKFKANLTSYMKTEQQAEQKAEQKAEQQAEGPANENTENQTQRKLEISADKPTPAPKNSDTHEEAPGADNAQLTITAGPAAAEYTVDKKQQNVNAEHETAPLVDTIPAVAASQKPIGSTPHYMNDTESSKNKKVPETLTVTVAGKMKKAEPPTNKKEGNTAAEKKMTNSGPSSTPSPSGPHV